MCTNSVFFKIKNRFILYGDDIKDAHNNGKNYFDTDSQK